MLPIGCIEVSFLDCPVFLLCASKTVGKTCLALIIYKNTQLYILGCKIGCLFCNLLIFSVYCGERGIRTPGASQHDGFQDRCNRPLYHLSNTLSGKLSSSKAMQRYGIIFIHPNFQRKKCFELLILFCSCFYSPM